MRAHLCVACLHIRSETSLLCADDGGMHDDAHTCRKGFRASCMHVIHYVLYIYDTYVHVFSAEHISTYSHAHARATVTHSLTTSTTATATMRFSCLASCVNGERVLWSMPERPSDNNNNSSSSSITARTTQPCDVS